MFEGRGEVALSTQHVVEGRYSLMIKGTSQTNGVKVLGPMIPCKGLERLELRGAYFGVSGIRLGFWMDQLDAEGNLLQPDRSWSEMPLTYGKWFFFVREIPLYDAAEYVRARLIGYPEGDEVNEIYLDHLRLFHWPYRVPPMPSQYKLRPSETDSLTAADVVGPDGLVYPNWKQVGVQGDIPDVPVAVSLVDRGAQPGQDISGLLQKACDDVGEKGGGAVLIGPGAFLLHKPVCVTRNGVIIRGSGRHETRLLFNYQDAPERSDWPNPQLGAIKHAAIEFRGGGLQDPEWPLAEDGRRGDTELTFRHTDGLRVGDRVEINAPLTPRFKDITQDISSNTGWIRINTYEILALDGRTARLSQPLRIDFPAVDDTYVRLLHTIEACGIEDLTIEHTDPLVADTVRFDWSWNCWARNMHAARATCNGIYAYRSKWHTIRDCEIDHWAPDAYKRHNAYGGYTSSWDCLWERNITRNLRHAPQVQFGAQGCVFRDSVFEGSDLQWHAGWCTENLFENCIITSVSQYGSYGYGAYMTGSGDCIHGPNGPRNVIYNCDFTCEKGGICLSGVCENQMVLHNRFVTDEGPGLLGSSGSFDHIVRNNTVVLKDGLSPMIALTTRDCTGIDAVGNTVHGGSGKICQGRSGLASDQDNRAFPLSDEHPPRPVADPPSIYKWQQRNTRIR